MTQVNRLEKFYIPVENEKIAEMNPQNSVVHTRINTPQDNAFGNGHQSARMHSARPAGKSNL